jgi:arylsulfatase A-like enzyme
MRLIYFDLDTVRADHLDAVGADGIRFENVYASDTPCLPSRSALSSGQFGIKNGVVGHAGSAAIPRSEGRARRFRSRRAAETWPSLMQGIGMWTASISTFANRHSAYHFLAGFNESYDLGTRGIESADQVAAVALDWLRRNAQRPDWFLHVHMWDAHTPYRAPTAFGDPFATYACPDWLSEEVRATHWGLPGPHSAQEVPGFGPLPAWDDRARQPQAISDMGQVRRMFDGYDTGVAYADHHVGRILAELADLGFYDDVAVMVSSDHGETLGELGIYCDHQTADQHVTKVPMIVRWPGGETGVDDRLLYQIDVAASVLGLMDASVPESWDGIPTTLGRAAPSVRPYLVLTQGAWTAQRSVRFADWIYLRTFHDGYHGFPEDMLFDVVADPHEQHDLAPERPEVVLHAQELLRSWKAEALAGVPDGCDPLDSVLLEGGPWHAQFCPAWYPGRLRDTGRGHWLDRLEIP